MAITAKIVRLQPGDWIGIGPENLVCVKVHRRKGRHVELAVHAPREIPITHHERLPPLRIAGVEAWEKELQPVATYGRCPWCGAAGILRERRPGGNDKCGNGHVYPSAEAVA